jgi:hypothetical protein
MVLVPRSRSTPTLVIGTMTGLAVLGIGITLIATRLAGGWIIGVLAAAGWPGRPVTRYKPTLAGVARCRGNVDVAKVPLRGVCLGLEGPAVP